jgi:hypothetical protein
MTLFYQGSLQEGIAAAVRDTKAVICFVRGQYYLPALTDMLLTRGLKYTDDEELSTTWEETYFGDDEVCPLAETTCAPLSDSSKVVQAVNAKAVVLRLTAGSQEAGFLASFCPITKFPTVIIIKCAEYSMLSSIRQWLADLILGMAR